ncbi:MAG: 6-carboxytetrahydropterin synthase QueD [Elusimicrobia bacterium]|nr:6-carboxytetrahydropterin synthase QueD [Elusimicrobiota bacterium]
MYKISVLSFFSAAHHLINYRGNCENVHGHNWKVKVTAGFADVPGNGMAMDFRELKKITDDVLETIDHRDLNGVEFFSKTNPTSENIARYIFGKIKEKGVPVCSVTVFETENYSAAYSEDD